MDEKIGRQQRVRRERRHDLAYVLGQGASVGRSRVWQDAVSVAPLVLLNAVLVMLIYTSAILRGTIARWDDFGLVSPTLAAVPVFIALVLVSLRDHEQPITVAAFVTGVTVAVAIALLSALRLFISYTGVLFCSVPTVLVMIVVMLRLQQAQSERVAILDFPGVESALLMLGGRVPVIRDEQDLADFDRFLIDVGTHYSENWARFLLRSYMRGILVTPWVQFLEKRQGRVEIGAFDLSDIVLRPSQILYSRVKRAIDIVGVIVATPFALVMAAAIFPYILLRVGWPVIFMQQRRGYGGRNFTIYKFRSMKQNVAGGSAAKGDTRILRGMTLIRQLRLDEIPQLINIWRGDMSWVGPRPATVSVAEEVEAEEPKFASRLLVRPGLSGWAQVNSGYAHTVEEEIEKLGYDLYYVKNMSFDLDLLILATTLRVLLFGGKKK
jgi:lipopolysaccharide/colanic/teichoic acid biosynthesis glycosyltransferase